MEPTDVQRRAEQRIGVVLKDKYRLERVLGVGGMASVYAATHRNRKRFAVKMLHAELSVQADIRARFLREGYAANSVEHPGAVAVLDDDTAEDGSAFLVMELLDGASVEGLCEASGGRLGIPVVLAVAHQLLDVLAAAHDHGIVHRDIKPANLFVTREGQLKVLDFGIARVRDVAASSAQATGTGFLMGTPAFMAPEQALAKSSQIDAQTDVWAVGATMLTTLTGRSVHDGDNAQQILIRAATTAAPLLATFAPSVPAEIAAVVDRALAFDKAQRWPTAAAMREALERAHEAVLGQPMTYDALASLFGRSAVRRLTPVRASTPDAPRGPSLASAPEAMDTAAAFPLIGRTTAQPISSTPAGVPTQEGRLQRTLVLGAAAIGVILLAGGAVALRRSGAAPGSQPPAPAPSAASQALATSTALEPLPSATAIAVTPSAQASAATGPAAPPAGVARGGATPGTPPRGKGATATAPSATPPGPGSASPAPKPDCNPPYTLDPVSGDKIYKRECYAN